MTNTFETIRTIISIIREKDPPPETDIVVSLDELCQIWLPYNNSFQPVPAVPAERPTLSEIDDSSVNHAPADGPGPPILPVGALTPTISGQEAGREMMAFNKFYEEVIEPYRDSFVSQRLLDPVNRIIEMLEKYGHCPSIITEGFDSEAEDVPPVREALLKVTLKDHTYRVARNAFKVMKDVYHDGTGMAPVTIMAALCHDIGKVPHLRQSNASYAKMDHPKLSVQFIEAAFQGELSGYPLDLIKTAVRDHHLPSKDQFTVILKQADVNARAAEVAGNTSSKALEWVDWFDAREFLALLRPRVNVIQTGTFFKAFSFKDTVYCDPALMHELAGAMASCKNIIDLTLSRESERDSALRKIVESLRNAGCVPPELGKGFITRKYRVQLETRKIDMFFIPLCLASFQDPQGIDDLKKTYPAVVTEIALVS